MATFKKFFNKPSYKVGYEILFILQEEWEIEKLKIKQLLVNHMNWKYEKGLFPKQMLVGKMLENCSFLLLPHDHTSQRAKS